MNERKQHLHGNFKKGEFSGSNGLKWKLRSTVSVASVNEICFCGDVTGGIFFLY